MCPSSPDEAPLQIRIRTASARSCCFELIGRLDAVTASVLLGATHGVPPGSDLELDVTQLSLCDPTGVRTILKLAVSGADRPITITRSSAPLTPLVDAGQGSDLLELDGDRRSGALEELAEYSAVLREDARRLRSESDAIRARSKGFRSRS